MRLSKSVVLAAVACAGAVVSVNAFQPSTSASTKSKAILRSHELASGSLSSLASTTSSSGSTSPCAMPNEVIPVDITARNLRSAVLTDANGDKAWCEFQQQQQNNGGSSTTAKIGGPIFISIGDEEKLNLFLEKNPCVPRENALVDDYSFDAYKVAGFGRFDEVDKDVVKEATKNMGAPDIGLKGGWDYITSAGKLAPIPKDMKFGEIPEGVLRLGGTFVVSGDEIKYRWSDRLPGDHPNIEQVYKIALEASVKKPTFQLPNFFGL